MFSPALSPEEQRGLAKNLTTFLSTYKHISDSYIIEFFSEDLWNTLPIKWQQVLCDLSPPQIAELLLDPAHRDRRYPMVWPLSLLAFRATAHALAFPRLAGPEQDWETGPLKPEEFLENQSQSSLLGHIFRKHVKPKKQHEIRRLGMLVKQLCDQTDCQSVVDVGSGQGHLTRFLSFGLGLSVTAIEADHALVAMASKFDGQLLWTLEKEKQKKNGSLQLSVSGPSPRHVTGWVTPKASWEVFIKQLIPAECIGNGHQGQSIRSKKKLGNSEQWEHGWLHTTEPEPLSSTDCATSCLTKQPQDSELPSQHQSSSPLSPKHLRKNDDNKEFPCDCCCRCAQPVHQAGQCGYPAFVLTGLHACGDLSATLLHHFVNCPHVRGITSVACCYMKLTTKENPIPPGLVIPPVSITPASDTSDSEFGYPMSSWVCGLPGHQLSYKAREGACHAIENYLCRLREESRLLRTHCYRAMLETVIRGARPELRRAGIQTIKKAHLLPFTEYARLGLPRVGLPAELPLDLGRLEAMLKQQGRVVVYFSLALLLAPVVETLVLLDRMIFLQENGIWSRLVPLFDPNFSSRNLVLVALKSNMTGEEK
ncbi:protein RRNAD1 [Lampris incognitus]|uniref:protein RRNAD1 n=1 Tax=Lampris incognitus TaxID=2546036 RepID=UPI0024B580FE|nr:protein RRNAD1 [Lampris incognitus]